MSERYFGRWNYVNDVNFDFYESGSEAQLLDAEVLFASYENEDYSGYAVVLFERNGTLMEVGASHCSCYGLEGQFEPCQVTWEALALRLPYLGHADGFLRYHSTDAIEAFRELVMSHVQRELEVQPRPPEPEVLKPFADSIADEMVKGVFPIPGAKP